MLQNKKSIYLLIGALILSLSIGFSQSTYYNNTYDYGVTDKINGFTSGSTLINDSAFVVTEFIDSSGIMCQYRLSYHRVNDGTRIGVSDAIYEYPFCYFNLPGHHSLNRIGSSLYAVGCKQNSITDSSFGFLFKYALDGSLIDTNFYSLSAKYNVFKTMIHRSGFIYVAGSALDDLSGDAVIAKLDTNGNLIDYQTYGGIRMEYMFSIDTTIDGGLIASGWSESYGTATSGYPDFYVIKVDSNLNLEWYKTFGFANEFDGGLVKTTSDGNYLLFGSSNSPSVVGAADAWIAKLDQNGDTIWTNYLLTSDPENDYWDYNEIDEVIELDNGNLAVAMQTMGTFGYTGLGVPIRLPIACFMLLNPSGDALYSRNLFIRPSDNYPRSMIQSPDGGFIIGGFVAASDTSNSQDGWIVKLDSNYCESDTCSGYSETIGIEEPNSFMNSNWSIFPNPSTYGFNILPPPGFNPLTDFTVSIYNCLGQAVYSSKGNNSVYIETNYWTNGIYSIRILDTNNNRIFYSKVVISN